MAPEFFVFPSFDRTGVWALADSRARGSPRKKHSHVNIAFYATCNWHTYLILICNKSWWTSKLSTSFPFSSVKGCCERGSKRTKHKATNVSFYATRNLRTSAIMNRDEYDSLVQCGTTSCCTRYGFEACSFSVSLFCNCRFLILSIWKSILKAQQHSSSCTAERSLCRRSRARFHTQNICACTRTRFSKAILCLNRKILSVSCCERGFQCTKQ